MCCTLIVVGHYARACTRTDRGYYSLSDLSYGMVGLGEFGEDGSVPSHVRVHMEVCVRNPPSRFYAINPQAPYSLYQKRGILYLIPVCPCLDSPFGTGQWYAV